MTYTCGSIATGHATCAGSCTCINNVVESFSEYVTLTVWPCASRPLAAPTRPIVLVPCSITTDPGGCGFGSDGDASLSVAPLGSANDNGTVVVAAGLRSSTLTSAPCGIALTETSSSADTDA